MVDLRDNGHFNKLPPRAAFVATLLGDLQFTIDLGVLSPAVAARHGVVQLSRLESLPELMRIRVSLPGRPVAAGFVHARHAVRTPIMHRIATGYLGARLVPNRDLVLVATSPTKLDRAGVPYWLVAGNPLLGNATFGLSTDTVQIDEAALQSGSFAGRGATLITNIAIDGSADEAHTTSHVRATHWINGRFWTVGGTYRHRLVRSSDGWRVSFISIQRLYEEGDRAVLKSAAERVAAAGPAN